jgi:O-antigen/teichoic acid export membrane protein
MNPPPVSAATTHPATVTTPVTARLRRQLANPLYVNVYALTINTLVSSMLGIGYWILAARLYSPRELGAGAAVISTMTFLSSLCQLNLNGALARFLPAAGRDGGRLIAYSYAASCGAALLVSSVFLLVAPAISVQTGPLSSGPLLALAFVLSVAAWGVFTLQDSVLTALRGAIWVPVENAAFCVAKILLLVLLATAAPTLGIFVSWTVPVVVALVPMNVLVFRRLLPRLHSGAAAATLPARRVLFRFVTLDYVGFLFLQVGTNGLPLLVTAVLGAGANAVFYIGWLLGTSAELVAYHFGTSLTVESAANESRVAEYARQVLRRGLFLFVPGALLLCLSAPLLLTLFGGRYAADSTSVLRLLALAVIPKFVVTVFIAVSRVQRKVSRIVLVQAATSTIVVSLALFMMPALGVTGVAAAYLTAQVIVAAATLPVLVRVLVGRT